MVSPCRSATYLPNAGLTLAALCLGVAATPHGATAATPVDALLQPTPLILKDGRIAEVSVHVVPFQAGRPEVGPAAAGELAGITRAVATDCFLTAQVIGHVAPSEVAENDSLAAHRLARSRADAIQASLIGGGLPAKAIASVWDWQFLVPEPRATLWLFRLTEGEDCDGTPLAPGASELVAEAESAAPAVPQSAPPAVDATPARPQPDRAAAPPAAVTQPVDPRAEVAQPAPPRTVSRAAAATPPAAEADADAEGTAHIRQAEIRDAAEDLPVAARPEASAVPAGPALAEAAAPARTREVRAASPARARAAESAPPPADRTKVAHTTPVSPARVPAAESAPPPADRTTIARATPATRPTPSSRSPAASGARPAPESPAAPRDQAKTAAGPATAIEGGLVITFATNSSYFPPGTGKQLRSLIRGMAAGERYRIILQAGVSGSDKVAGASTPEEARRYNRWLAERRVERVQTWLNENAAGADLVIEPQYLPGNEERTVVVQVAPTA
jgi:hypothetical protein